MEKKIYIDLLKKMLLIRSFENRAALYKNNKKIEGSVHCYNGEEAVAVGICKALCSDDYVISNHRPHGHAIAKGVSINDIAAELFGKEAGCNGGKGGSMHLHDSKCGFLASTGIVGSGLPLACGPAFASVYKRDGRITCVFFGDGTANEGTLHESLNLAAKWNLPIIFVLEDNGVAVTTLTKNTSACQDYVALARCYGIEGTHVDGQNVEVVYNLARRVVEDVRKNIRPYFIQAKTCRFSEHQEGEYYLRMKEANYRDNDRVEIEKNTLDPIVIFKDMMIARHMITEKSYNELVEQVKCEVTNAYENALVLEDARVESAYENIFV